MTLFPPRAMLVPLVPGGPLCVVTIVGLYGILRGHGNGRWHSLRHAISIDWAAWRYSRAMQREVGRG
jgi:hypothetical protein